MSEFWYGLLLSTMLAYPIFRLLLQVKSRQTVSEFAPSTHQAKQGTPTMGGLLFVVPFALLAPLLEVGPVTSTLPSRNMSESSVNLVILGLFLAFAVIGFVDDFVVPRMFPGKRGLGWKPKLAMQFVAAGAYSALLGHRGLQIGMDVVMILAAANAYNFADGLDGLAASVGLLLLPGLMVAAQALVRPEFVPVCLLLGGTMLPFAFLNAPKAKVFMGDVGSLPIGALVGACLAVPVNPLPSAPTLVGIGVLLLVLVAELVPVPLQILWVKLFKRRLFPFTPIHHAFEKAGWPETRVVATFALVQLICTLASVDLLQRWSTGWSQG